MFGKRLKILRKKRNLSQVELYIRSGVSQGFISELEKGKKTPTISTIEKLAIGLNCSVTDFFQIDSKKAETEIENVGIINI